MKDWIICLLQMYAKLASTLSFTVTMGRKSYKATNKFFLGASKMGAQLEVIKPKDSLKMIEFEALYERSAGAHNARVIVRKNLCSF